MYRTPSVAPQSLSCDFATIFEAHHIVLKYAVLGASFLHGDGRPTSAKNSYILNKSANLLFGISLDGGVESATRRNLITFSHRLVGSYSGLTDHILQHQTKASYNGFPLVYCVYFDDCY